MAIDIVEPRDPDFLWESNKDLRKELEIKNTKIKQLHKVIYHNCN